MLRKTSKIKLFSTFFLTTLFAISNLSGINEIPQEHKELIQQQPYRVLAIGHACMDLNLPIDEDFLQVVGGEKGGADAISSDRLTQILNASSQQLQKDAGGSAANTLKGLSGLGEKCGFVSLVGQDDNGEYFSRYMKDLGITTLFSTSSNPTARILCLVTPDAQRTMRFNSGCSHEMRGKDLHPDYFNGVALMHLDSYNLFNDDLMESAMKLAKQAGTLISIDLSSFEVVRLFHPKLEHLITHYVDIVFANEDEVKEMTGLTGSEGCLKLQEICPTAVVLAGKQGCFVGHNGKVFASPCFPAKVVDTTGAGDLFISGFLYGYLQGCSLEKCAVIGNRMGSAIVEVKGANLTSEKWNEIHEFLKNLP
jgi:sugar/nucleoside kinase (ribokinase family)